MVNEISDLLCCQVRHILLDHIELLVFEDLQSRHCGSGRENDVSDPSFKLLYFESLLHGEKGRCDLPVRNTLTLVIVAITSLCAPLITILVEMSLFIKIIVRAMLICLWLLLSDIVVRLLGLFVASFFEITLIVAFHFIL